VFCLLHNSGITRWLTPAEVTYSYLAAVCHDLDHPGNSNVLELATRTAVAQRYPESPLENHHRALSVDRDGVLDEFGLLSGLDAGEAALVRHGMSELILATDMAKHAEKTGQLKQLLECGIEAVRAVSGSAERKCLVLQNVMKLADISNQGRTKRAADFWNAAIYEEFYAEGDRNRM
jgi:high affinity cGMP-specific 3',5'-cyclic phosphodiesterase 9